MSRKKTTTIKVRVPTTHELLMQEVLRSCPGLEAVPSHATLAALARESIAGERSSSGGMVPPLAIARLEARCEAVTADPSAVIVARAADPGAWSEADRLYAQSREALTVSPARATSLAEKGDQALRTALESGARALASEERTLVTAVMDEALRSIGCRTTVAEGDGACGIWAERGHQLAAVLVQDGGKVELDVAGFEGDGCLPFHEEIEHAVSEHGGTFEDVEVIEHGDSGGGALIREAALAAGPRGSIARGIVAQAARGAGGRFSPTRSEQAGSTFRSARRIGQ